MGRRFFSTRYHRPYAVFVGVVWLLQTLVRLAYVSRADTGSPIPPMVMHASIAASLLCMLALALALLSVLSFLGRMRPLLATSGLAFVHAAMTAYDVYQATFINLTGQLGPTSIIFSAPLLVLSLLDNIGLSPMTLGIGICILFAVHVLLYAPMVGALPAAANRLVRRRLSVGRIRVPMLFALILGSQFPRLILYLAPPSARADMIQGITAPQWDIAPPEMLAAANGVRSPDDRAVVQAAAAGRPIVLIVVDALRRDRMGVYDPALRNTPFLSELDRQGRLRKFEAYSTCTFSFCGIMSIFASRSWNDFGTHPRTLIDQLTGAGYKAHLILAGEFANFGGLVDLLGRPLASIVSQPTGQLTSDHIIVEGLEALPTAEPQRRFIYLHLMSTHAGTFIEPRFRVTPDDRGDFGAYLFDPGGKAAYRQIYDGRVRQADDMIRRAFAVLKRKGLLEDALVVITADHGQRVSEGGMLYHGGEADPPTLKIPLLIYDARADGYAARGIASQIDVAPTIARAAGVEAAGEWKGVPLQLPTRRVAVPVGTSQSTGIAARAGQRTVLYLCNRRSGRERITDMQSGHTVDGSRLMAGLRGLHRRIAAPVRDACGRLGRRRVVVVGRWTDHQACGGAALRRHRFGVRGAPIPAHPGEPHDF